MGSHFLKMYKTGWEVLSEMEQNDFFVFVNQCSKTVRIDSL